MAVNVRVSGLVHSYGRTRVLKGIDLEVGKGVFGLLGPNGAGKTTLLRVLATVFRPGGGDVQVLGYDPTDYRERRALRRRLGYLPQTMGFYGNFTVWEFVEYFALMKEVPVREVKHRVARAVEQVGLGDLARKKLKALSGGMLRRVGIAQAIVNEPDVLLLDEPTAGLDPEQRVAFRQLIREMGARGTVIVSTHLVEDVGAACSEVAVMSEGRIVFCGPPAGLASLGSEHGVGDSPLERGYSAALARSRVGVGA